VEPAARPGDVIIRIAAEAVRLKSSGGEPTARQSMMLLHAVPTLEAKLVEEL